MNSFCTIVTPSFAPFAKTLFASIKQNSLYGNFFMFLASMDEEELKEVREKTDSDITLYSPKDLCKEGVGKKIYDKYFIAYMDGFRWSMKSVFINFLLEKKGVEKIIFLDSDIFLVNNCDFLFSELDKKDVLLTPHWRPMKIFNDTQFDEKFTDFGHLFNSGIYNAGFIGVNKNAGPILKWWAEACYYRCEINPAKGLYVDQTYLNLFPLLSEKVGIVYHRGCNVANWNKAENILSLKEGKIFVNDAYPVIFVHFTQSLIESILHAEQDHLLRPTYNDYTSLYEKINNIPFPKKIIKNEKKRFTSWLYKIKYRIRIRTRLRKFWKG